jgi:hypothetical protein
MKRALAILSLSFVALGCATLHQETTMYRGPVGRTEIGGYVVAADPSSSKVLLQTYDGDLWVFDVESRAAGRLGTLMVGEEINLAFDDRVAGQRVVGIEIIPAGRHPLPGGVVSVASLLPFGVTFGAPAVTPSARVVAGTGVIQNTGIPLTGTGIVVGTPGVVGGTAVVSGTVIGPGFVGNGVIVPGFGSFSTLPAGMVTSQTAASLGLGLGSGIIQPAPGVAVASGPAGARAPITGGNFSPGTISPGVTTANPAAPGAPVLQGPFTPGTTAPGASVQRGTAPPAILPGAGTTTTGTSPTAAPRVQERGVIRTNPGGGTTVQPRTNPQPTTQQPGSRGAVGATGTTGTTAQPARPATTTQPQTTPRQNQ